MHIGRLLLGALAGIGLSAAVASAETIAPTAVKFVDGTVSTSLTGSEGDPEKGAQVFKNVRLGNCLACHVNSAMKDEQFHGETGTPLDGVADRYDRATLRAILVDSKKVFGDETLMPAFYRTSGKNRVLEKFAGKTILTAQQVEDVLAYLMTLKE